MFFVSALEICKLEWFRSWCLNADVLSMEWGFVGLSEVLPLCSGSFDWSSVDNFLANVDGRGHQAILRPIVFGPGYGQENYAPSDLIVNDFFYEGTVFNNPDWNDATVQTCILKFIDGFALRYKNDKRIAYIQMGLAGLWGEHHLDGATYSASNFPSFSFQKTIISHYINGFGNTVTDLLTSLSLDAAQDHGFFSTADTTFDTQRFGFFDDSLLTVDHGGIANWRQEPAPALQLTLHRQHGWGGEAYWTGCNSDGSWAIPPNDCGNGEPLNNQAARLGLNYMLGSPAFEGGNISATTLLLASQMMGYKFTVTAVSRQGENHIEVIVQNTGVAHVPYQVQVCTTMACAGDLSTLAPADNIAVVVPASNAVVQTLSLSSPRLDPQSVQKIRWSNAGADDLTATLTVEVNSDDLIFADDFE